MNWYAEALSQSAPLGKTHLEPRRESARRIGLVANAIANEIANAAKEKGSVMVLTGAGISVSCGIPDFRSSTHGVWSRRIDPKRMRPDPAFSPASSLREVQPSFTHRAIAKLVSEGLVDVVVSQNVDDLHYRSGVSPEKLLEVHGNFFVIRCDACKMRERREEPVASLGLKRIEPGLRCEHCKDGWMCDTLLDFDDEVELFPECSRLAKQATFLLVLGSSLMMSPVNELPLMANRFGVVNLSETKYDRQATHVIRADVDEVMRSVMLQLNLDVSP